MKDLRFEVSDDSGFLALVDPVGYKGFVDSDWNLDQLFRHFKKAIKNRRLALWGTGRTGIWRVEVRLRKTPVAGFREFSTQILASGGQLLLTNYESLTMAAQFDDVSLPKKHQRSLLIPVTAGMYDCRVVQKFDPETPETPSRASKADFFIELSPAPESSGKAKIKPVIPWSRF